MRVIKHVDIIDEIFLIRKLEQQLLENEGVKVVNNQIIDFEKHFWHPEIQE